MKQTQKLPASRFHLKNIFIVFETIFYFNYVNTYVYKSVSRYCIGLQVPAERSDLPGDGVVGSCLIWVLWTKVGSFARVLHAFNYWAITITKNYKKLNFKFYYLIWVWYIFFQIFFFLGGGVTTTWIWQNCMLTYYLHELNRLQKTTLTGFFPCTSGC